MQKCRRRAERQPTIHTNKHLTPDGLFSHAPLYCVVLFSIHTHTHINTYERKRSHVKNNFHTFTLRLARRVRAG